MSRKMSRAEAKSFARRMADRIAKNTEWTIEPKKFRNKRTGEVVTQFSILDINNFEEVQ